LDCPLEGLDQSCIACYRTAMKKEKEFIQEEEELEKEDEEVLDQLQAAGTVKNRSAADLKRALKLSETKRDAKLKKSVKEAFKRALEKTTNVDEMIKMVKEDVGETTYKRVVEAKRFVCGGVCIAFGPAVVSGLMGWIGSSWG